MTQTLQGALEALYGLERRKNKLGLEGTRELLAALGDPQRRFRSIHVAGTNGKGSTCALIERALRDTGRRTGLFTSPHLVDFRERIRVNGQWADESWLFDTLGRIQALPGSADPTFFEVVTALGFAYFAAHDVEWAVVEVGLGGRLDTTNVLEPEVCAITSVGLDHTEILGDTIEQIAAEKAGIIKPGVPVVLSHDLAPAARAVIERIARERGARVVEAVPPPIFAHEPSSTDDVWALLASSGSPASAHHGANLATATAVLDTIGVRAEPGVQFPADPVDRGLWFARWPGRFERAPRQPRLLWDGAHNPEGASALAEAWHAARLELPAAIVLAVSRDKDLAAMLDALAPLARNATLFATRTRSERALEPDRIEAEARARGLASRVAPGVGDACRAALDASAPRGLVLLCGSLFAVGEAMEVYGGAPGEFL